MQKKNSLAVMRINIFFFFRTMNKYSNFTFLNTLLELHHMMNFDKIFSIFHWTMVKKNYLVEHPEGVNIVF
jgi:hypothetical protein